MSADLLGWVAVPTNVLLVGPVYSLQRSCEVRCVNPLTLEKAEVSRSEQQLRFCVELC